jgi:hypothetical protein
MRRYCNWLLTTRCQADFQKQAQWNLVYSIVIGERRTRPVRTSLEPSAG